MLKDLMANNKDKGSKDIYQTFFNSVKCTSEPSENVTFVNTHVRIPPNARPPVEYLVKCTLRDCEWSFKVKSLEEQLKLTPEKSAYNPLADAVSVQICRGPKCRGGSFGRSISDTNNHLLRGNLTKDPVYLHGLYCRTEVFLVAQDRDEEAEPVRRKITLRPREGLNCSQKDVYVTPASALKPIPICSFTSAKLREVFANEIAYDTYFEGIRCISSEPALKLEPEKSKYVQGPNMKIKLQVCLGPTCRSNGLKANLTDEKGRVLIGGITNTFTLNNIFCWKTLTLIATTPEEPEPVRRTISLSSEWTYRCSTKDVLVTWGKVGQPIILCSPTSKESKEALAKEADFERIFKDARCNCSTPGVKFSTRFLHLPSNASPPDSFPIQCQLHECQWSFLVRVVKEQIILRPERDKYDPRSRELVSLRLCAGEICRSTGIRTTLTDRQGDKLLDDRKSSFSLYGLFCRSTVNLFCLADGEPDPSNRTLQLHPLLTPECSQQDVYVAPGVRSRPVSICNFTSKMLKDLMANNKDKGSKDIYQTFFNSVKCTSEPSENVTFVNTHVRIPPNARPPVEYLVKCTLRDCEWSFKVKSLEEQLKLTPEKSAYNPLADAVSVQICRGPKCRGGSFGRSISDTNNHLLRGNLTKDPVYLHGLYCRTEVFLVAQDRDEEAEPVRRKITLRPREGLNCSQKDVYVTPASALKPIPICSFTSAKLREVFANEIAYDTYFEGIRCISSEPALKLEPEKSKYVQGPNMKIKLQVCLGPTCRSNGLKANLTDEKGRVLIGGITNTFTLNNIFCWKTLTLIATTPEEPEPVRRTISLSSEWTYRCSTKDVLVTWGKVGQPIILCSPTSKESKEALAKEADFERIFKDARCNCSTPGVKFSTRFLHLPSNASPPDSFPIQCQLHECQWSFLVRVVKEQLKLTPEKSAYNPLADAVSVQICRGPKCRGGSFGRSISDTNNHLLRGNLTKDPVYLHGLYCRTEVFLVAQDRDEEAEPVRRKITLRPREGLNCSQKDVYVTPASALKPIPICSFTSAKLREVFANEIAYDTYFEGIRCISSEPALKLEPEKSKYVQGPNMKIKLQVCLGPTCRSNGLKANLTDEKGRVLIGGITNTFTLNNIFCWKTLTLIATTPEEPEPVRRTISLSSEWTYRCSTKDVLVTWGKVGQPIILCSPTSKESKEALAKEADFERIFKDARCNCSTPGVKFSTRFLHLPSNASPPDSFPIQCQLHECQWSFLVRVVKEQIILRPERDKYDPRSRELVSLRLCAGEICRSTGIRTTLTDRQGDKLLDDRKSSFSLYGLFCRSTVNLFCLADGEPDPSNRTLQLHPLLTPECSQQDVYVAPGVRSRPVSICNFTSKMLKDLMANNKDKGSKDIYQTFFNSVKCTSEPSENVTFVNTHVRIPPNVRPPVEYLVKCTLRDCEWSFKVKSLEEQLKLTPEKSAYNPLADAVSVQICRGPKCRGGSFGRSISDTNNHLLRGNLTKDPVYLHGLYCRTEVFLVAQDRDEEAEPVRRKITLRPREGLNCSQKDVYVTPASALKPIPICSFTSAKLREVFANEIAYDTYFEGIRCISSEPALKLEPEKSKYVQGPNMKIKLQVCLGPTCRSNGLKANLTDEKGRVLIGGITNTFTLNNIFCWKTLTLIATTPEEPEPVRRTISLSSEWTYRCSTKDVLVTWGKVGQPIILCSPTSKESKEALAKEADFERIFKDARCNCSTPGVKFSTRFLHLPSNASPPDSFPIQCQLHECQWSFLVRVVKEQIILRPERDKYDPRSRELVSLRLCAGEICRSAGIRTTLTDRQGDKLLDDRKSSFSLYGLFCRSTVNLFCLADGEPDPSNRTLQLHPLLTPECSQQDVYVAPGVRSQPVSICNFTSKMLKDLMANNKDKGSKDIYQTFFNSVKCTSEPSENVTFVNTHVRIPPNVRPPVEYLVKCTLRDCEWSFKVKSLEEQLKLTPEKSAYNPLADAVSVQICRGPKCRGGSFGRSIYDTNNHLLRGNLTKDPVYLHGLYCRTEVFLVAQDRDEEAEPVRRKITLRPREGLDCSQKDVYVTPASALKPIPICSFTSAKLREVFANEIAYDTYFEGIRCISSEPEIILRPERDKYDPRSRELVSLRLCAGEICRSTGIRTTLTDRQGDKLLDDRKSSFSLYGLFCRSTVNLFCLADGEPDPSNRTLQLHPLLTPECSQQDVYVAPGVRSQPVSICNFTSKMLKDMMANNKDKGSKDIYQTFFNSVKCTSEPSENVTFVNTHVRIPPNVRPPVEYLVKCTLRDCEWSFKVKSLEEQLKLTPEKSAYNPLADAVSVQICRGPKCRGGSFGRSISDTNNHLLRGNLTKDPVYLHGLYCRTEVFLVAQDRDEEAEPVRRKITLRPREGLNCSQKDVYVTPASALKPIPICSFTSAKLREVFANEIAYDTYFEGIRCISSEPEIILRPERDKYDPRSRELVSLRLCAGEICRSTGIRTTLTDRQGDKLLDDRKSSFSLYGLFCRSTVNLFCLADGEPDPSNRTLQLHPLLTPECSQQDVYVAPGVRSQPVSICNFTSKMLKDLMANNKDKGSKDIYQTFFNSVKCTSEPSENVTFVNTHVRIPPNVRPPVEYLVKCTLRDCEWSFKVKSLEEQLKLTPEKSAYNPLADAVSVQICRGPKCRGGSFGRSISDTNNHLLRGNLTKDPVYLHGLYCRTEVFLVAQDRDEEAEPVRRKITLRPREGLNCSQKDVYVTPASALKPIPICSFTSAKLREVFANEIAYDTYFEGIRCISSEPGLVPKSNRSIYNPERDELEMQLCLGPKCRSQGLQISILGEDGSVLATKLSGRISLRTFYCRAELTLVGTVNGEPERPHLRIKLSPTLTYNCSEEPRILTPVEAARMQRLCSPRYQKMKSLMSGDKAYTAIFKESRCTTTSPGVNISAGTALLPKTSPSDERYSFRCGLLDCQWNVEIFVEHEHIDIIPKKEVYNPAKDKLSLRICLWTVCRSTNLSLALVDMNDRVIEEHVNNSLALKSLVCRSLVILTRRPIHGRSSMLLTHNVTLSPMQTYECAIQDLFVTPEELTASRNRIRICQPTRKTEKENSVPEGQVKPAEEDALYKTQFKDATCKSTAAGIRFAGGFATIEKADESPQEYPVQCRLYECVWDFTVVKGIPGKKRY
ncbi:hypothetical protein SprV_0301243800 [Sparganum proliferum]